MSEVLRHHGFHLGAGYGIGPMVAAAKALRRVLDGIDGSGQRRIDREAGAVLARSGGRLTDAVEREIDQRLFGPQ